ncbi:DUF1223 domain-containing protein [Cohaesibacter celericrescens]|uniref:DUF1223 domain-containing protein n=1 Tax=Cohaesibacter celericrescens TaxID=2067669 RepID=A0A2N5XP52_9HYPH|nr:DUF1223 domain-containing protein [Cohaesibacter celericrescens]PLW76273.1 DUF1223 domain-containing protein [Cohaesibacter celericrescens]
MMIYKTLFGQSVSRRFLIRNCALLLASGLGLGATLRAHAQVGEPVVVVELFTSQGCSSCPPADKLLGELSENPDMIVLTEAVDYWDYLGWKDKNANHEHTVRQKNYARMRGDRSIYTPQMVINGRVHVVGSRAGEVTQALQQVSSGTGRLSVPIKTRTDKETLSIEIAAGPEGLSDVKDGTLFLVPFRREVSVDVERGENKGRKIVYHNVVDQMRPIGMWHGKALNIELPMHEIRKGGHDGCAVLLQADVNGLPGPIYGAAMIELH